jgi:hypothetical protein
MKKLQYTNIYTILLGLIFIISCSNEEDLYYHQKEYRKQSNKFIKEYVPKLKGEWKIEEMHITPNETAEIFKKDTILYNVGKINISYIEEEIRDEWVQFITKGYITINLEEIPFITDISNSDFKTRSIVTSFELGSNYFTEPITSDQFTDAYKFLDGYFLNDNYKTSLDNNDKTLILEGLNRSTKKAILTKIP